MSFQKLMIFFLTVAVVLIGANQFLGGASDKAIHDYIMNNPKVLMDSVAAYQQKMQADQQAEMEKRQANAGDELKKNKSTVYDDANSPTAGDPNGDVTMVEFFDYNCHYCKGAFPEVQDLMNKDKKVRFIFKEFPILAPTSQLAAQWALAANKQGKYFAFHTAMMNNKEPITDALLEKVGKDIGLDIAKAKQDLASPDIAAELEKNHVLAEQLAITGTPTFIIGDQINRGVIPEEAMVQEIKDIRAGAAKK